MVQIKAPNKLVVKVSPSLIKMKNSSPNIKPSSPKGADLAMKLKKPRSDDRGTLKETSPNYMKSTRCSEARKVVSSSSSTTCNGDFDHKSSRSIKPVKKCSTATCSSTLKDRKSPSFLDLNPGGTESQGASVVKVCSYNHCSLNEHTHDSNPPLKSFLSAKRRELKIQRIVEPVALAPCKKLTCKDDKKDDFSIEIYVKETCSKGGGENGMLYECEYENATSITALDELFAESSDAGLEEENRLYLPGMENIDGNSVSSDQDSDNTFVHPSGDENLCLLGEEGVGSSIEFFKEFIAEKSDEISRDEIADCYVQFSDSESSVDDEYQEIEFDEFLQDYGCSGNAQKSQLDFDDSLIPSNADNEGTEELLPLALDKKIAESSNSTEKINEENSAVSEFLRNQAVDVPGSCQDNENASEELNVSDEVHSTPLIGIEDSGFTMQTSSPDSEETGKSIPQIVGEEHQEFNSCKNLKTTMRNRKQGESSEALRPFNPRGPNYLEVKPDPEAEKVDLRHQEMDQRKNAEEWMIDYALRNKVNQLAPVRRRKVALLVEAFETLILPSNTSM